MNEDGEKRMKDPIVAHIAANNINQQIDTLERIGFGKKLKKEGIKTWRSDYAVERGDEEEVAARQRLNLERVAFFDPLTGLKRKEAARPVLLEAIRRYRVSRETVKKPFNFGVCAADIDLFSWWNDVIRAHAIGDVVLNELGKLFLKSTKKEDELIRDGGEEFLLVFANIANKVGCEKVVQRLQGRVREELLLMVVERLVAKEERIEAEKTGNWDEVDGISQTLIEFVNGLVWLHEDKPFNKRVKGQPDPVLTRPQKDFREGVKGPVELKNVFINRVNDFMEGKLIPRITPGELRAFAADRRSNKLLSSEERRKRFAIETQIAQNVLVKLFESITISCGVVHVGEKAVGKMLTPGMLHRQTDSLRQKVKETFRGHYIIEEA